MFSFYEAAGIVAAILSFVGFLFYADDILRKGAKPSRATWIPWAVIASMIFLSYRGAGAEETLYTAAVDAAVPVLLGAYALFGGTGGTSLRDRICMTVSISSIVLWLFAGATVALALNLAADLTAAYPTMRHASESPEEESRKAWTTFTVANVVNCLAIDEWTFGIAVFPFELLFITGTIMVILYWRRGQRKEAC